MGKSKEQGRYKLLIEMQASLKNRFMERLHKIDAALPFTTAIRQLLWACETLSDSELKSWLLRGKSIEQGKPAEAAPAIDERLAVLEQTVEKLVQVSGLISATTAAEVDINKTPIWANVKGQTPKARK